MRSTDGMWSEAPHGRRFNFGERICRVFNVFLTDYKPVVFSSGAYFIKLLQLQNCAAICVVITQFCNFLFHKTVAVAELPSCVRNSCSRRIARLRDRNFKKVALIRNSAAVAKKISHHKLWCEKKLQFCNSLEKTKLM